MNQRLDRLMQLLQLKEEATRNAYMELIRIKEEFEQNKVRHEQLVGYRYDYTQQLEVLGKEGASISRLRNRIDFINHLDAALHQLNAFLAQLAKTRMKAEYAYKRAKTSEEGVSKLIERAKKTEEMKQLRIEQKESDEYAQKQWYGKQNND